jgi:hypothetical protein
LDQVKKLTQKFLKKDQEFFRDRVRGQVLKNDEVRDAAG